MPSVLRARITGIGSYVPENIITNRDLESLLDTSDEWIQQRTGIQERRWASIDQSTTDLALIASERAIENAGLSINDIDMIIFATLSPDHDFPGNACFLQSKLNRPGIAALDIRQQCSGFLYGLSIAQQFIQGGQYKNILLVGAEIHSKGLDKTPEGRGVSVLFGDGAGACVISATQVEDPTTQAHLIGAHLHADGQYAQELWVPGPGTGLKTPDRLNASMLEEKKHFPFMNGKTVFVNATKRMAETLTALCAAHDVQLGDVDLFLFHQANIRINDKVGEMLGLDASKVFNTIAKFGNTTAATIPLGLDAALKAGAYKPGMLVASAAFGSGFTWASALWRS
jgi:3-oxoacyl-[acyl-carrier-protein] synthase III